MSEIQDVMEERINAADAKLKQAFHKMRIAHRINEFLILLAMFITYNNYTNNVWLWGGVAFVAILILIRKINIARKVFVSPIEKELADIAKELFKF